MDAYTVFKIYRAFQLHFTTPSYDLLKYGFRSKVLSYETYCKNIRHEKNYEAWSHLVKTEEEWGKVCIANFAYSDNSWLFGDKSTAIDTFKGWQETKKNFKDIFKNDYNVLAKTVQEQEYENWKTLCKRTKMGNKPPLLQISLAGKIHVESLCNLSRLDSDFIGDWSDMFESDPYVSDFLFRVNKYTPFCCNWVSQNFIEEVIQ